MMNELLKKIYDDVLVYEKDIARINIQADKKVDQLIKPYAEQLTADEYEKLDNLLSETTYIAQQAGFENGVRFAVKLMLSLLGN